MARAMKDSGIEWIGEIPVDWKLNRIQYCLNEIKVTNNPIQTDQVLSLVKDAGVMLYEDKGDVGNKAKTDVSEYKLAFPDTLVVNSMNILIGSVGISKYFGCVSPVYYVFKETENADLRFVNYVFNTREFQKELRKYANGILEIRLRVSASDIFKRQIALPTKQTQQIIADYLDAKCAEIDALTADIQAQIETLEQYKRSVITEAVTKGLNPNAPMKDSGTDWMGMVPRNWVRTRIKYCLCEIDLRSITGKEEPLSMSQRFGIIPTSQIDVPHSLASYVGAKIAHPGDLVFNKLKAHLGVFSVSQYTGLVSPDYAVYRAYENVNAKYLEYLFKTDACIAEFKKRITGVGQGLSRLYTSDLFAICVAIPQKVEQDTIVKLLDAKCAEIDAIIDGKLQQLAVLEEYKKSLIFEYVTGKKEVPVA